MTMLSSIYPELDGFIRNWGEKARYWQRSKDFAITEKSPGDFVTNVDKALDQALTQQIRAWFPQDGILSEEGTDSALQWQVNHRRLWCIDPIDGTYDFVHGGSGYAVMIGILEEGEPIAGWVYAPAWDILYFGDAHQHRVLRWQGNYAEEISIVPPQGCSLQVILSEKDTAAYGDAIRCVIPDVEFYSLGSFGLKIMEVVLGKSSMYLYLNRRVKVWDTVAPFALAKAAGLVCCDLRGEPIQFDAVAIDAQSLTHRQVVVVGWRSVVDRYLNELNRALQIPPLL